MKLKEEIEKLMELKSLISAVKQPLVGLEYLIYCGDKKQTSCPFICR
jgi:hypothetical protein